MEQKCAKCGTTEDLTIDHIIPKWIYKRCHQFGFKKNLGSKNKQILCRLCNFAKDGGIDCSTEVGLVFWKHVRNLINDELKKYE